MRPADPENQKRQIEKILRNARRLFARHGYDRVSMDKIAAACRLTKPSLYYYFKDKHSVLLATLRSHWREQALALLSIQPARDLRQTLKNFAELLLKATRRPENNDIIRIVLAESARHQEIGQAFFRELGPVFGDTLTGLLRPHLPPRYSRRTILTLFHQFVGSLAHYSMMSQIFKPGRSYLPGQQAYVDLLVQNFIKANCAPQTRFKP
jgi:TetR/AcrR family transcriptional regulator